MLSENWPLKVFNRSFKKKEKFNLLKRELKQLNNSKKVFFVTCGGNNGALNLKLSLLPGRWFWGELEAENIPEMENFLKQKIYSINYQNPLLPFDKGFFDLIILLDVLEHVPAPEEFCRKMLFYLNECGQLIIGTPTGRKDKPLNILKKIIGLKPEFYGHLREGFNRDELLALQNVLGLKTERIISYSRFWTELLELMINYLLLKVFKKRLNPRNKGNIAPQTGDQFRRLSRLFVFYRLIYPIFYLFSLFDRLIFFTEGYAFFAFYRK